MADTQVRARRPRGGVAGGDCMGPSRRHQLLELMELHRLEAVLLERPENHAAFLGIRTYNGFSPEPPGRVAVLIPLDDSLPPSIVANRTEVSRIAGEELDSALAYPYCWSEPGQKRLLLEKLTEGLRIGADVPGYSAELAHELLGLRASLLPEEIEEYRRLSRDCASIFESCVTLVRPGVPELHIAAWLTSQMLEHNILPAQVLVAADERLAYRHAVPTPKPIARHVQLSVTASRSGLFTSLTRILHFGRPPADLQARQEIAATIDAHAIAWTKPDAIIGHVFRRVAQKFSECGWPDEWKEHHQGGSTGFSGRELKATAGETAVVKPNQAWAWNPTIGAGAKSEDTVLVTPMGHEIMTCTPRWPTIPVKVGGETIERNGILTVG